MRMIFLGPPGAGKGTQAQKIHEQTSIPLLVMGDMLRASVQKQDEVGKEAQKYMEQGTLVPDEVVIKVILSRMQEPDCQEKGFMLDGFPRTLQQAQALDQHLEDNNWGLDMVIYYSLPDEVAIERMTSRRMCKKCKRIFSVKNTFRCPTESCQGEHLYRRKDDDPEVVPKRIEEYHEKTSPLLGFFKQKGILKEVSAHQPVEDVFQETMKHLRAFS